MINFIQCDRVEDGWKGIRPLTTNKVAVESLLGKARVDDNDYYMYETKDAYIEVNYSTTPCKENRYGRGKYNVPEGTVLGYRVMPRSPIELSQLKFDKPTYAEDKSGDVLYASTFRNRNSGIAIEIRSQMDGRKVVDQIRYMPPIADSERLRCNKIDSGK